MTFFTGNCKVFCAALLQTVVLAASAIDAEVGNLPAGLDIQRCC